ncbi:MAG TPA: hypothetical protein VFG54_03610 [Prolixibacteraceae bacterium]|nr:hypothetical protein [Prolixibacteraceae bacterium]
MNNEIKTILHFDRQSELNSFFRKVKERELSEVDIYEYVENFTDKFNETKLKLLLRDMLHYLHQEEIQLKKSAYTDTLYDYPGNINHDGLGKQNDVHQNFKVKAENKHSIHEADTACASESFVAHTEAEGMPEHLNPIIEKIMQRIRIESQGLFVPENLFPHLFIEGGFILFFRLAMKYTIDDNSPVSKFSNLFHFFKYEQILTCTQAEYLSFIESHYDLKMSKVLPAAIRYHEMVKPMLERILRGF